MLHKYYSDNFVTLYCGDVREVLPAITSTLNEECVVVTDPPYGETHLGWDQRVRGWVSILEKTPVRCLWCFGSLRFFMEMWTEFHTWKFAQEILWEKHNGSGFVTDRFRRVHEFALQFYRGPWSSLQHNPYPLDTREVYRLQRDYGTRSPAQTVHTKKRHVGSFKVKYRSQALPSLQTSVIHAKSCGGVFHPTEKPQAVLLPLIRFSCPTSGIVLDPFAGSGSTLLAARTLGIQAIGIEKDEKYCETIARRFAQQRLPV